MGGTIEPELLGELTRRARLAGLAAAVLTIALVVGFVLGMRKTIPAAFAAVMLPTIFAVGAWATAIAVGARWQRAIGQAHGWRRESCTVTQEGIGRWARIVVRIPPHLELQPVDGLSNSSKLVGHTALDVAGDPRGRLLLRIPGSTKLHLFKEPRSGWEL